MSDEFSVPAPTIPVVAEVAPAGAAPTDLQYMPRRGTFDLRGATARASYVWRDGKFYEDDMRFVNATTLRVGAGAMLGSVYKSTAAEFYIFFGSEVIARTADLDLEVYGMFYSTDGATYYAWPTSYGALRHPIAPLPPPPTPPPPPTTTPSRPEYESLEIFQATSRTTLVASFDPPNFPDRADSAVLPNPATVGQVTIRSTAVGPGLFVAASGGAAARSFGVPIDGNVLTSDGEQDIDIALDVRLTAVGFNFYTSGHGPVTVTAYDASGAVLESHDLQPDGVPRKGFLGFQSEIQIAKINWRAADGQGVRGGIAAIRAGYSRMPQGLLLKEWMRLGGPYGAMGWPSADGQAPGERAAYALSFQNGAIAIVPDVWWDGVLGAFQEWDHLVVDWTVSWDDPSPFDYDKFVVRIERDGVVVSETEFSADDHHLTSRGYGLIAMGGRPEGAYAVWVEGQGLRQTPAPIALATGKGAVGPAVVHYTLAPPTFNRYADLDLTVVPPAATVDDAVRDLDRRTAAAVLCNACQPLPLSGFNQPTDYGLIALAKIAYPDYFHSPRLPGRDYDVREEVYTSLRRQKVDAKVGTTSDPPLKRTGDYDPALARLLVIAYKYRDILPPDVYDHIVNDLLNVRGLMDADSSWPFSVVDVPGGDHWPYAPLPIPESENHLCLIESSRYLTNQLLYQRDRRSDFDNQSNAMTYWWLNAMSLFLRQDFIEYNARPYQDYTMAALLNLASFASEPVKTAAQMVLDYVMAKVAVSSNDSRRSAPFRRRNEPKHRGPALNTGASDPQTWFSMGLAGTTDMARAAKLDASTATEVQWAGLSAYRVPDLILDLMVNRSHRVFFQQFSHAAREAYASSPSYLISAGGTPALAAYSVDVNALIHTLSEIIAAGAAAVPGAQGIDAAALLISLSPSVGIPDGAALVRFLGSDRRLVDGKIFSTSDLGVALATALIPTGQLTTLDDMVRFEGSRDDAARWNLGVAPDFACGINPVVPALYAPAAVAVDYVGEESQHDVATCPWVFIDQSTPEVRLGTYSDEPYGYYLAVYRFDLAGLTPAAPVAAVSRNPDQMDLFAVGHDGGVYNAWWNGGWNDWIRIGTAAFARSAPVAAVSRNPDEMDLFAVGKDGGVYSAYWDGSWHDWFRIGTAAFAPKAPIAAVSRNPDQMDLFAVAHDGGVYNAWWNGNPWRDWTRIGTAAFAEGTPVAAISRNPNQMDLFAVAHDGGVYNAWWNGNPWRDWTRIGTAAFAQGTPIAAISRNPNQMDLFAVGADGGLWSAWWDNTWHDWFRIGTTSFAQGTPVVALTRNPNQMDLFAVGKDGGVYNAWRDGTWHEWIRIGTIALAQVTPVAALTRNPNQMDLFAVQRDGGVYNAFWDGKGWNGNWNDWLRIGTSVLTQDTPVAALTRNPNQMDLFAVGKDGGAYSAYWDGSWHDWFRIGTAAFAPKAPITAVSRNPDQMDLFAVAHDGGVYNAWWNGNPWRDWTRIGTAAFAQGTPIAAISRNPNQMDLFAVGADGGLWSAWWDNTWHDWFRIGTTSFAQGTPIAALTRNPNQMDLFAVGADGGLWSAWWDNTWHDRFRIGTTSFAQGTPIAALTRNPNQMDLFAVGKDGGVCTAWWDGQAGNVWHEWGRIGTASFAPGTPIAAISRNPNQMDLFAVGTDGGLWSIWWDGGWHDWFRIHAASFPGLTPIAAISRNPNQMDLFAVGTDGGVYNSWWGGNWQDWSRITNEFGFLEAYDTKLHRDGGDRVPTFDDFRAGVLDRNRGTFTPAGNNSYAMTDGRTIAFQCAPKSQVLTGDEASFFLKGDILNSAPNSGVVTIDNLFLKKRLVLDMSNPSAPSRVEMPLP